MKLDLVGVTKRFGAQTVLDGLGLQIADAHRLVIMGPSGSGKSTLLRVLAGLIVPESGSVNVNEARLPNSETDLIAYRRSIGVVFQAYNLFPHLSALKNLTLPLVEVHGLSPADAKDRAITSLSRFALEAHMYKTPAQLSGGQRQRVAIARALSIKPRLLLFDEPTSALDPDMTGEVLEVIEELASEGRDLILVTHHIPFARRVADHAVLLVEGKVVEHGPGVGFFESPEKADTAKFFERVLRY